MNEQTAINIGRHSRYTQFTISRQAGRLALAGMNMAALIDLVKALAELPQYLNMSDLLPAVLTNLEWYNTSDGQQRVCMTRLTEPMLATMRRAALNAGYGQLFDRLAGAFAAFAEQEQRANVAELETWQGCAYRADYASAPEHARDCDYHNVDLGPGQEHACSEDCVNQPGHNL